MTIRSVLAAAIVLFAGALALTPAQAADLGGDCCADLEERVAELEATTVRKGNRKVSVKLSGQVNRAVMWWDDGDEQNVYVVDNDYSSTRFRFTGDANWKPGWKIGFALEWQQEDETSSEMTARTDDRGDDFNVRQAHWWVKSDRLGKLRVGQISSASDAVSEVNLSGATVVSGTLHGALYGGFFLVNNAAQASPTGARATSSDWVDFVSNFDGLGRQDGVRYDSPTYRGFTLSTGWYEDDMWDVALRFAKQWNSVLFAAAIGYAESREGQLAFCENEPNGITAQTTQNGANDTGSDCSQLSGSMSILHQPTGLFATFAAGHGKDDARQEAAATAANIAFDTNGFRVDDEADFWYANFGVNRRFNAHGKTSIGVEYMEVNCGFAACGENNLDLNLAGGNRNVFFNGVAQANSTYLAETEVEAWGVWLVQNIDNAATEFYIAYQHAEFDATLVDTTGATTKASSDIEDMDVFVAGARIKF